jgi:hypothetical protein
MISSEQLKDQELHFDNKEKSDNTPARKQKEKSLKNDLAIGTLSESTFRKFRPLHVLTLTQTEVRTIVVRGAYQRWADSPEHTGTSLTAVEAWPWRRGSALASKSLKKAYELIAIGSVSPPWRRDNPRECEASIRAPAAADFLAFGAILKHPNRLRVSRFAGESSELPPLRPRLRSCFVRCLRIRQQSVDENSWRTVHCCR